ncbi:MAG: 3-phosphoglycerate dehydrogenase family protein [Betaproteobacteria bacterium]
MSPQSTYRILVLNQIAAVGLKRLPHERYTCGKDVIDPDAVLVRSQDMHEMAIAPSVKAIARAGAGTNNIPVATMNARGAPVFNAPGANANAVKELVLTGLLLAVRNLVPALQFVDGLKGDDKSLHVQIEEGKKQFAGSELPNHTLGIIGLGKIGSLVADTAIKLGMNVLGYDPEITVEAAWSLPSQVKKANSVEEVLKHSHFVTLHIPLLDKTRNLIDAKALELMRPGSVLLNFSRDGIVDDRAVAAALAAHKLKNYVCDFPSNALRGLGGGAGVIALPHLGASTREAEDNSAVMVVDQLRDYLEHGNVRNAVNFPEVVMAREAPYRVAIANSNVPNMLGQISTAMAQAKLNIHNMLNKSRGDMAYTLVDVDSKVPRRVTDTIAAIHGVLAVRYIPVAESAK